MHGRNVVPRVLSFLPMIIEYSRTLAPQRIACTKFLRRGRRQGARSIKPKFPEIPVQNQMERNISKSLFRKFRSTSRGCPFFRKCGNTGNFLFHLAFHHQIDMPDSPRRFLVSYPPQKRQYLLFGCNEWSPMWISYRHATSLDNALAENTREVCLFPFSSENDF